MNSFARRYGLKDLEKLARQKTAELGALIGDDLDLEWPPKWHPLLDWEIEWFLRAYHDYSLFELRPRIGKSTKDRPLGCPHVGYVGSNRFLIRKYGVSCRVKFGPHQIDEINTSN